MMTKPQARKPEEEAVDIPHKLFYKIGEVSKITKLEPYVLRYWETEFLFLRPRKGKSKQRMYQKKDIEILLEIKRLLYHERFTIEGVRKKLARSYMDLAAEKTPMEAAPETPLIPERPIIIERHAAENREAALRTLEDVKGRLRGILRTLRATGA
jgi:DNA-binding transcriptional MerR regulator